MFANGIRLISLGTTGRAFMSESDEVRLIDANELKKIAYQRFGLSAIKLITLVDEMPTKEAKEKGE